MAAESKREHYIPVRCADLVRALTAEAGAKGADFKAWCDLLSATLHAEYHALHEELKDAYACVDPEATTVPLRPHAHVDDESRAESLDRLFGRFDELLRRANFRSLDRAAIEEATQQHSEDGVDMRVDFSAFERLELYVRGDAEVPRTRRRWYRLWREEDIAVPVHRRLVLIVKLAAGGKFPRSVDTDDVFLRYFKDIPRADIEMLLPGTRLIMPAMVRLKLGSSLLTGLSVLAVNLVKPLLTTAILGAQYLYGMLIGLVGYGWRQYAGYQSTRAAVSLRLTESLYYQNVASNASVFFSLLDEAEEQDAREAILAYYHLWRHAGPSGWTLDELDASVERDLEQRLGTAVDFEVDDALVKLERFGLVTRQKTRYVAVPIHRALTILDERWDNRFRYANPAEAA